MNAAERPPKRRRTGSQGDLVDRLKRQTGQIAVINTVVTAVSQSLDLNETLQTALRAVLSIIPVESSGISLVDEQAGELVMRAQYGLRLDFVTEPMRIKMGHGMSGQAVTTGELVVVRGELDKDDPRLYVPAFANEATRAMVLAPMHVRGKVIGVLSVMSHDPYDFSEEELNLLRLVADQIGIAIDNARLFEAAKREQSRLEAVLQSTADAIIALDLRGNVSVFNQAAESLFKVNSDDWIGKSVLDVPLPELIHDKFKQGIWQAPAENGNVRFDIALEGDHFYLMILSRVYAHTQTDEMQMDGWVTVFQDVTHLKEAERARLNFIQQAAHDLRNPLGVTLSALTMLNRNWKEPTPADQEVFNIALTGINRMQDLIDDLLNLEHIESGVDFRHEPMSISELVERCVGDMGPMLQRREQKMMVVAEPSLPTFYGDERWLYRALMNLLSNAHKYTPIGSMIKLRASAYGNYMVLSVEDNGPGIPMDAQLKIFDRFFRIRTTEKVPGTGLGLAIVKSVAEKHGGRAYVSSEPGYGATFRMILPISKPDDESSQLPA
ncbi:MAG: GAF domain-containing protein [Anaerolineae bacterium]|nr:GAF domain-containing protein [Anaerolineae bacterium]